MRIALHLKKAKEKLLIIAAILVSVKYLSGLNYEFDCGSGFTVNIDFRKGRNHYQIDSVGGYKSSGYCNGFNRLINCTRSDCLNFGSPIFP